MHVLSGETIAIEMVFSAFAGPYVLFAESGQVVGIDDHRWNWMAPRAPGRYQLVLTDAAQYDMILIEADVMERPALAQFASSHPNHPV